MAAPAGESTQFVVHFEGLKLPPEAEQTIAREVRAAAFRELARLDLKNDFGFRIPREDWIGIRFELLRSMKVPMPSLPGS